MPFRKIKGGKYVSPSGRKWTAKQVKFYYATGGTFKTIGRKPKRKRK
jgi:hypothetical protein